MYENRSQFPCPFHLFWKMRLESYEKQFYIVALQSHHVELPNKQGLQQSLSRLDIGLDYRPLIKFYLFLLLYQHISFLVRGHRTYTERKIDVKKTSWTCLPVNLIVTCHGFYCIKIRILLSCRQRYRKYIFISQVDYSGEHS